MQPAVPASIIPLRRVSRAHPARVRDRFAAISLVARATGGPPPGWEIRELAHTNGTPVYAAYGPGDTLVFTLPARDAAVRVAHRLATWA